MNKYLRYVASLFVLAVIISAIKSIPAEAGNGVHPDEPEVICLCFGDFSNGFNATLTQRTGKCASFQIGPFCFVNNAFDPIFWKETVQNRPRVVSCDEGEVRESIVCCESGKMVLSCMGFVSTADPTEPAANVASNIVSGPDPPFRPDDDVCCTHRARCDRASGLGTRDIRVGVIAVCAAPGPLLPVVF